MPVIDDCLRRAANRPLDLRLQTGVLTLRLRHFADQKDAAGCRTTAELWEKLNRTDAASLLTAARMWAVTGKVSGETADADRAMAKLTAAVAAGYSGMMALEKDKDFDGLRVRPEYQRMMETARKPVASPPK